MQKLKFVWNTALDSQRVLNFMRNLYWRIFLFFLFFPQAQFVLLILLVIAMVNFVVGTFINSEEKEGKGFFGYNGKNAAFLSHLAIFGHISMCYLRIEQISWGLCNWNLHNMGNKSHHVVKLKLQLFISSLRWLLDHSLDSLCLFQGNVSDEEMSWTYLKWTLTTIES